MPRGDFVCFRPDGRKAGKCCVSVIGEVRRIDEIPGQIILLIGERYPFTASAICRANGFRRCDCRRKQKYVRFSL